MKAKKAIFIGGVRFDITVEPPPGFSLTGDMKMLVRSRVFEYGGSAARAVQVVDKLGGVRISFMTKGSDDDLGQMFRARMKERAIDLYEYKLEQFPAALVFPSSGKRAALLIDSPEDDEANWNDFTRLDVSDCDGVYSDGRLPLASIEHFKMANRKNIPTLLDGCAGRACTDELLRNTRYAIVSSYLCDDRGLTPPQMLEFLKSCGCEVGAVTLGEFGLLWYQRDASEGYLPSLVVPRVKNSNGAGDVLHAEVFRNRILHPELSWREHFTQGRAAATHVIQHLSDRLPTQNDIANARKLPESTARPEWLAEELR